MTDELRMHAYYYGFEPTGVREIDLILSAVAEAGKAFHHTQQWGDELDEGWAAPHEGLTPEAWIQNAADKAASALAAARREGVKEVLTALREKLRDAMKQCDGVRGGWYAQAWQCVDDWCVEEMRRVEEGGEL